MSTQLIMATRNSGKVYEINQMIDNIELLSLDDIGFTAEIPEPFHTFEENALAKASAVFQFCQKNVFAEDSGLCIDALNGRPGVDSAHYCGERDDEKNLQKVLAELINCDERTAYYKAVICLIWNEQVYYFEGFCNGKILTEKQGRGGFGYDPIFVPDGYDQSFAQLPAAIKNSLSHRGMAVKKMKDFMNSVTDNS